MFAALIKCVWRHISSWDKIRQQRKLFILKKAGTKKYRSYNSKITLLHLICIVNMIQQQWSPILCNAVTCVKDMEIYKDKIILSFSSPVKSKELRWRIPHISCNVFTHSWDLDLHKLGKLWLKKYADELFSFFMRIIYFSITPIQA